MVRDRLSQFLDHRMLSKNKSTTQEREVILMTVTWFQIGAIPIIFDSLLTACIARFPTDLTISKYEEEEEG